MVRARQNLKILDLINVYESTEGYVLNENANLSSNKQKRALRMIVLVLIEPTLTSQL